ncbi:protein kinase [Nocardia sp. NPDC088792]|uniref:serine/threonine-protein kinase n=1 Tax=Nocardia sp. NPDC088792 TaxID=3364332 RepID=UPI003825C365
MPGHGRLGQFGQQDQLGHYRLVELLGRGGMGQVWLAEDTNLEREVALKLLPSELAADTDYRRRFEREARLAARLRGPHIVPIHSFGELDGRLFIDMELVDGSDLGKVLAAEGALSPSRAVDLIAQVAEALDVAHGAGLIHRDVKPSNVLTLPSGFAYLIDFGIARGIGQTTLTTTGAAVGTWAYMAPERFSGSEDLRSDVYSLACMLFECLVGRKPFAQSEPAGQMAAHLTVDPPRPSTHNLSVPTALDGIVTRGMAKDPAHRYPTAGALATAARAALGLQHSAPSRPITPAPPTTKWDASTPFSLSNPHLPPTRDSPLTPPPSPVDQRPANPYSPHRARSGGSTFPPDNAGQHYGTTPPGPSAQPWPGSMPSSPGHPSAPAVGGRGDAPGFDAPWQAPVSPAAQSYSPVRPTDGGAAQAWGGGASPGSQLPGAAAPTYGGFGSPSPAGGTFVPHYGSAAGGMAFAGPGNPYAAAQPGFGFAPQPSRRLFGAGRVVWWIVLGLLFLFFGVMTIGVIGVSCASDWDDVASGIAAWLILVLPFLGCCWLVVREVRRLRRLRR